MYRFIVVFALLMPSLSLAVTYDSKIKLLQVEGVGDAYNTVHLTLDITGSPCSSTNDADRFAIVNNAQQSAVIAAVMVDKTIKIMPTGNCNSGNIEEINFIMLKP